MNVERTVDNPIGDGSKVRQVGVVLEQGKKFVLTVHGMGAFGENERPKQYPSVAAIKKAGWSEVDKDVQARFMSGVA